MADTVVLIKGFYRLRLLLAVFAMQSPALVLAADPTQPPPWLQQAPARTETVDVPLVVQQILIREGGNRAVINGQLVRSGDVVDGAQVMTISADKVVVKIRQKRRELSLLVNTRRISE